MAWVPPVAVEPTPSSNTSNPITKMKIRISFEKTKAMTSSTQRRTHDREKSARLPANANGLRMAATMISSLRTVRANQTTTTATNANSDMRISPAGLEVAAETEPGARIDDPHLLGAAAGGDLEHPGRQGIHRAQKQFGDGDTRRRGPSISPPTNTRLIPPTFRRNAEIASWTTKMPTATTTATTAASQRKS